MSDTQAVPVASNILESFQRLTERPEIKKVSTDQTKIASLANNEGFEALQTVINGFIEALSNIPINPKTDTPESVGFRYLASQVTIEYLKDISNMPKRYAEIQKKQK